MGIMSVLHIDSLGPARTCARTCQSKVTLHGCGTVSAAHWSLSAGAQCLGVWRRFESGRKPASRSLTLYMCDAVILESHLRGEHSILIVSPALQGKILCVTADRPREQ